MIPLRLVVDTNIVVSATLKPNGLQRTVLLLAITKPARLYVSNAIFGEYRDVLSRAEFQIPKGLRQQLLDLKTGAPRKSCADSSSNERSGGQYIYRMRRCCPCRLPCDRERAALSKVLEEYQGRHLSRVPQPSGASSCRLEATSCYRQVTDN